MLPFRVDDYFFLDRILEISRIASITTTIMPKTRSIEYTTFVNPLGAEVPVGITEAVGVGVAAGDTVGKAVAEGDEIGV